MFCCCQILNPITRSFGGTGLIFCANIVFRGRYKSIVLGICQTNDSMLQWSFYDWCCLLLSIAKKCNLEYISRIQCSYKLINYKTASKSGKLNLIQTMDNIVDNLQNSIQLILIHNKEMAQFFKCGFEVITDSDYKRDMALQFDTLFNSNLYVKKLRYKINKKLNMIGCKIEDRSMNGAFTFAYVNNEVRVLDHNCQIYKSRQQYISKRILAACSKVTYDKKNNIKNSNNIYRTIVSEIIQLIQRLNDFMYASVPLCLEDTESGGEYSGFDLKSQIEIFESCILRKQIRQQCYKYHYRIDEHYERYCQICHKIRGKAYPSRNDENIIKICKIKVCPCKRCYVCSRNCQKIAWKRGHRLHCFKNKKWC